VIWISVIWRGLGLPRRFVEAGTRMDDGPAVTREHFYLSRKGTCAGLTILVISLWTLASPCGGAEAKGRDVRARNVVVLSGGRGRASLNQMESALRSRVPWAVNFSVVDLENPRFEEGSFRDNLAKALHSAYSEKPDLVVACMDPSLRFAAEYHDTIFSDLPIVFMSVSSMLADKEKSPLITGVAEVPGIRETIDLALRLHPDAKAIAVISGGSETERDYLAAVHLELLRRQDRVKEIDIVGPPSGQMLETVAALPPGTVVLFQLFPHDSEQPAIGAYDVLTEASQRLPTYSIFPSLSLDHGGIGGAFTDATQDAAMAGQMAARILSGEQPDRIPPVYFSNFQIRVDWRQLQRWHIPESGLPPGSQVLNRQPDVWQQYKRYIVAGITLILLETALIIALMWERARRRRSERELAIAYDRLRMALEAARFVAWDADYKAGRNRWFGDLESTFGISSGVHDGDLADFRKRLHPDDRERVLEIVQRAQEKREPYAAEFRVVRTDGVVRWISAKGKFYFSAQGEPERMLGMAADVTERKQAEEALDSLSGQLIQAQEEERRRIAREIHDDYQQRLAVLGIELQSLSQDIGSGDRIAQARLRDISEQVNALSMDLHSLSHRLHSSTLDSMGLVAALKGLCSEFRKYHDLKVSLITDNVPVEIPSETALCIFRITQEALQNVRKHSHARSAEVRVEGVEGTIRLSVSDQGKGFDAGHSLRTGGIGIRSMEERVRLVNGQLEVHSRPGSGTTIAARVPVGVNGSDDAATTSTAEVHS
jgi:signal transduction histidine kinase/ABC-type uncharacterized transport system substrate-binding protein